MIFWQQTSFAQRNEQNIDKISEKQAENVWQTVEKSALVNRAEGLPGDFQTLRLDKQRLASLLTNAPHESRTPLRDSELILHLPMPDGSFSRFRIQEAPVLEPSLVARFPEIKSYRAVSIDDPGTTARFDLSPRGFRATILAPDKTVSILPADKTDESLYASYDGASLAMEKNENFSCSVGEENRFDEIKKEVLAAATPTPTPTPVTTVPVNRKLKTYKIAVSATYEYTTDTTIGNGDFNKTVASINSWLNALNAIYERELSIRLIGVIYKPGTNDHAIYDNINDPYNDISNPNSKDLLNAVKRTLRDRIGSNNYNLGHVFTRYSPGGVAGLGNVCDNNQDYENGQPDGNGPRKGAGYTGFSSAAGNLESLKVFAHEIGHQFGANHSFNGTACGGDAPNFPNRSAISSYEPGGGNTIMAYHSVCGMDNVVGTRSESLRFHSHSFTQITDHVYNGIGQNCDGEVDISNSPPTIDQPESYTIPKFTPFTLTATGGSDPDLGDIHNLTYTWEQYQPGGTLFYQHFGSEATYNDFIDASSQTPTTRPIFRPMPPTTSPSRTFPSLKYILNNQNDPPHTEGSDNLITAEELPRIGRTLNFRVTVRDTLGGASYKEVPLTVAGNAGPFKVNAPNTAVNWTGGATQTVTWDVAGTNGNGVNTFLVKILLSTDGGQTFPIILQDVAINSDITANDGSAMVRVPNGISTTTARIKILAVENIFFDISDANFTITPSSNGCPVVTSFFPGVAAAGSQIVITGTNFTGVNAVVFSGGATATPIVNGAGTEITVTVPAGAQGGEIRVNKPGCGAALSGRFTICSGTAALTNLVDDGSFETRGYAGEGMNYRVNRVTPTSYPATLSEVRIYHPSFDGFPTTKTINIISGANPGGSENINNTKLNTRAATIQAHDQFVTYKVDPITINSGDFIVGYSFHRAANEPVFTVGVDQRAASNPSPNPLDPAHFKKRSYHSSNGIDFFTEPDKNYMIRAAAFTATPTPISLSDETSEYNGWAHQGKSYHVNRLKPSSYPATLTEVRIYHRPSSGVNDPVFPTNKEITVLSAANPTESSNINNTIFNKRTATVSQTGAYVSYQVDPITIHSGDFIVGYSFDRSANEPPHPIALDVTSPDARRSYISADGKNFNLTFPTENYMIRAAFASSNPCSNGACTYSVALTSGNISGTGGNGTISVLTQSGCSWKASRNVPWIRLTSGSLSEEMVTGTGNGTVTFTADQNTGTARTGGITFLGRIISVSQNLQGGQFFGEDPSEPEIYEPQALTFEQQSGLAPTAASVPIGGRVTTSEGNGISGAIVSLMDQNGQTRIARTNAFGYYRFDEIVVGNTIILNAASKRYTFTPQVVTVMDSIQNLDIVSLE
ncbi:MAG: M12 family metallo-peptidase [Acidobacteriota bacterium]|nr:M12 family metallo-peptidase [Acidobacteriota bacterium]